MSPVHQLRHDLQHLAAKTGFRSDVHFVSPETLKAVIKDACDLRLFREKVDPRRIVVLKIDNTTVRAYEVQSPTA